MIQNIQKQKQCSREYAVRFYDYQKHTLTHTAISSIAGIAGMTIANRYINHFAQDYHLLNKPFIAAPLLISSFFLSSYLYERTTNYYLNFFDKDIPHINLIDLAEKYNIKHDGNPDWQSNISITPYDVLKREHARSLTIPAVDGEKVLRRMGKDKDDAYYMLGKVRNLENIVYLDEMDIENVTSPMELQMKIDAVTPTLIKSGDMDGHINKLHSEVEKYKYLIENSKNFRSIKDKFLGLPYMLNRHQQYPEPARGTWQYELYENIFNESYDHLKDIPESEEKINKYNYSQFLHPSIIAKFDTDSEEFDMYLRQLNLESKTAKEKSSENRKYFCTKLLPYLNLIRNKEDGYDFANYIINKEKSREYENYLYEQYSGQQEEYIFREVEEYNYMNKNQPFVERTQYSTILKNKIGIKASELEQIFTNPTKSKNLRRAMERQYQHYESLSELDKLKYARHRALLVQTVLDNDIDVNDPKWVETATELQQSVREPNEEELAMTQKEKDISITGVDVSHNPLPQEVFHHYYHRELDWNDYNTNFSKTMISPKRNRYHLYTNYLHMKCIYF
jgi:hypothetical protein